jgi:hypothetical protein
VVGGQGLGQAAEHLGGHILERPEAGDWPLLFKVDGEAKVRELDRVAGGEEDVLGLDVL